MAAPASGHGKTTVATGLMAALAAAGHVVSGHKVGPDYIDPGYHSLATGRPGRNLDPHLVGEERLAPLLKHGARLDRRPRPGTPAAMADVAVIEGVMGLYDGQIGGDGFASTAHVAAATRSPVVLVVDISSASRTIGALVHGIASFDPAVRLAGVILNKSGSPRHADEVRRSIEPLGLPVLGVLSRDDGIVAPSRHLGLVPAQERDEAAQALDRLAAQVAERIDLDTVVEIARSAPDLDTAAWDPADHVTPVEGAPVVAVAGGRAFTFTYAETTELLEAAGCRVEVFDPLTATELPAGTRALYLGGGFPEVHAAGLTGNTALREQLRQAVADGVPTVAECAGLLYLCRSVDDVPMIGALDAEAVMSPRLTLAYRTGIAGQDTLLTRAGERVTAHEFHRTHVEPVHGEVPAWIDRGASIGFASPTLHASYLHTHWAGAPHLAQRLAGAAAASPVAAGAARVASTAVVTEHTPPVERPGGPGLGWHGDAELDDGLVDLAVNVTDEPQPAWLTHALTDAMARVGGYPDPRAAEKAVARRHGRSPAEVLATSGAAEAFTLVARARPWRHPVVVHPQFTEPEVALTAAGHAVHRVVTRPEDGFRLDPEAVPDEADLVIVGNPTNPTSVLHPVTDLRRLLRPGRVVVVDEAFMDAVPGERASLTGVPMPGLVVLRSLTKLWGLPGIRAGYVVGDGEVVAELRRQQPPWSVSTPALAVLVATTSDEAVAEAERRARLVTTQRAILVDGLTELGVPVAGPATASFVLARPGEGTHARLRAAGFAVRRADTFPGLDDSWVRIAVRRPTTTRSLLAAWRGMLR
ncbi:cobyrinate a,c-diamide synthase [Aeromicrobium sp.]|uniref:cobyrinate a,c-diamide synthase n=1 Tax=Aeromicrobium sp. TaxID=1871063 RepID=UPI0025BAB111|nr:cobyrinate a,c-diamide synthase [Aeromicrobium sp.]MCK5890449.1 cobyrinate a,c-diamide synthase [Aeromicrobium sp.]